MCFHECKVIHDLKKVPRKGLYIMSALKNSGLHSFQRGENNGKKCLFPAVNKIKI